MKYRISSNISTPPPSAENFQKTNLLLILGLMLILEQWLKKIKSGLILGTAYIRTYTVPDLKINLQYIILMSINFIINLF